MSWSHSRTTRFPNPNKKLSGDFTLLPSTLSLRSTGIGFGQRYKLENIKGMDSPPPGTYNLPSVTNSRGAKFSKGGGEVENLRYYTPGPGSYEPFRPLGGDKPKIAMKSRIYRKISADSPAPGEYSPSFRLTQYSGYANISFGVGERSSVYKKFNGPGPGTYKILSKFDKSR